MTKLSAEVASHDMSLSSLTVGELELPRLVLFLPNQPSSSRIKRLMHRAKSFVKDEYRLVFLDPVSGVVTPTGPDGTGYVIELPAKWLAEHAKHISDGLKVAKLALACGRMCCLPLPSFAGMPSEVVSKAEMDALRNFEEITQTSTQNTGGTRNLKALTGKSYKALRHIINKQCGDSELRYCGMQKVRANDGSIEFVAPESVETFKTQGKASLVWNQIQLSEVLIDDPQPAQSSLLTA